MNVTIFSVFCCVVIFAALDSSNALAFHHMKSAVHREKDALKSKTDRDDPSENKLQAILVSAAISVAVLSGVSPAYADGQTKEFRLPPINLSDKNRCVLNSSAMGQANAARDSLYDLRQCNLSGAVATG